jgi:hypothetical protein
MRLTPIAALVLSGAFVTGCGGGSGSTTASPATPSDNNSNQTAQAVVFNGTAATGAAFDGAAVSIIDKTGAVVGTGTTGADGSFSITLAAAAQAPFVIQAVRDDQTLVSVAPDTSSSTVNITPITNLIAARLSESGDPTKLAAELKANPTLVSSTTVNAKLGEVVAALKPLLDAVGTAVNPLTGSFKTDGSGMDRVLDSVSIHITPSSASTSNIEIAVRQTVSDDSAPTTIKFSSSDTAITALPTIQAASLVQTGTSTLIADLLQRMNACYALPAADRVTTADAGNASATTVKAAACKDLFAGNDPAAYLDSGATVGSSAKGAFAGLWKSSAQNVKFDRGAYEFTRTNGDLVVSFRSSSGSSDDTKFNVVRKSTTDNKLRFIGNQYQYPGGVGAYHQLRSFIMQPAADYFSTGYSFNVPNNGQFNKVVITTPKGAELTLVSTSGSSALVIQKAGAATGTSVLRLRGEFVNQATSGNPATYEANQFFAQTQPTNAEIATYPENSVWKYDYYLTGNTGTTPDAVQYFRTVNRALTIPELKLRALAQVDATELSEIKAAVVNGAVALTTADQYIQFKYTVPTGGLVPNMVRAFGRSPTSIRFDDGINTAPSTREAIIPCQPASGSDNHCAQVNGQVVFANNSTVNGLDIRAQDERRRNYSHFYATYSPLP